MAKRGRPAKTPKSAAAKVPGKRGRPPKVRTAPDAPGAVGPLPPGPGHNSGAASRLTADQERDLFLRHRGTWNNLTGRQKALDEQWASCKSALKADGFKVVHMNIADSLINPKGEKKVHAEVRDRLWVARMIGHAMGRQYDLFENPPAPDAAAAIERARIAGRQASVDNQPARPPHSPETPEYTAWMNGWHDHQEELLRGFKPLPREAAAAGGGESEAGERVSRPEFQQHLRTETTEVEDEVQNFRGTGGARGALQ